MRDRLRKTAYVLRHEHRGRWLFVLALALVASAMEALGAGLVYVLIAMVTNPDEALEIPVFGDLGNVLPREGDSTAVITVGVAIAAFFLVRAILILAQTYAVSRLQENAAARLASRLARGYMSLPYSYQVRRNMAELIRNVTGATDAIVAYVLSPAVRTLSEGLVIVVLASVLLVAAPLASVLVLALMGALGLVLLKVLQPRLRTLGRISHETSHSTLLSLHHSFQGMRDIRLMGRELFFQRVFDEARMRRARVAYLGMTARQVPRVVLETSVVIVLVVLLIVIVSLEGGALGALPILGLFAYAAVRLKPAVNTLIEAANSLEYAGASIDKVYEDLVEIESLAPAAAREEQDVPALPLNESIQLQDIWFRYTPESPDVLKGISLRIERGQLVGIAGPTGGGKSTLLDVIVGLIPPTRGTVRIDGVDLQQNTVGWQRSVAMVSQTIFLIDDTLRRNIAFGFENEEIDEERVHEAVRTAQLEPFVRDLPDGLNTLVGDRGTRLSGGQRQRVAIARALYRRASILVFDEGTSALDNETEAELLRALEATRADCTIIMVAHRVSTLHDADQVFHLRDGRIVEPSRLDDQAHEV